ncbi:MAG: helix-turn-helix domain-containing protein [Sulfuritalea sp.]|jgi:transcriptional regulator with XRE-family HTH domain|nr:helix-turn-helix domain-containing protein [Sulfuritalea sp.]
MLLSSNLKELGTLFRAERKATGKTQADVAKASGLRRETIIRIEAGENIDMITFLKALSAIGKGIRLADRRVDYDSIKGVFDES